MGRSFYSVSRAGNAGTSGGTRRTDTPSAEVGRFDDVHHYGAGFDVLTEEHGGVVKTMVGGLGEAIGTSSSLGTYRYYTHDHLGSVREVRDESAGLTAEFAYGPYGESYFAQEASFGLGPSDLNRINRGFTGHHLNLRGGTYWTPFRAYSPTAARWLTPGPLGMVDGPNMYAHVGVSKCHSDQLDSRAMAGGRRECLVTGKQGSVQ